MRIIGELLANCSYPTEKVFATVHFGWDAMIGHTLSAAGAVEAVFTLLTLQQQRIPPTINYAIPDPAIPLDVVPNRARDASLRHAISNSFGFGGQNVSLVMGLEPA